jgi:hypothetical protein
LVGLRSARQPAARRLHSRRNFESHKRGCRIQKSPKSQFDLKIAITLAGSAQRVYAAVFIG